MQNWIIAEDLEIPQRSLEMTVYAYLKFLLPFYAKATIMTVDKETMDYLYPPERRRALNRNCLAEVLRTIDEKLEEFEIHEEKTIFLNKRIEECNREANNTEVFFAVGLYVPRISYEEKEFLKKKYPNLKNQIEKLFKDVIFICPRRIYHWAEALSLQPDFLFLKVLFHELGHAYLNNPQVPYKGEWWEKVWEEGLANLIAYELLADSKKNIAKLNKIFSSQPLEYQTVVIFLHKPEVVAINTSLFSILLENKIPSHCFHDLEVLIYKCYNLFEFDWDYWYYRCRIILRKFFEGCISNINPLLRKKILVSLLFPIYPFLLDKKIQNSLMYKIWLSRRKLNDKFYQVAAIYILKQIIR